MEQHYLTTGSSVETDLDRSRPYVAYWTNEQQTPLATARRRSSGPAVTISDQTGAGATEIANRLAAFLHAAEPEGSPPWKVFDRQLVEEMLEEHRLPKRLAKLMPENRRSYLEDVLDEIAGLRPPSWELVPMLINTIRHLAASGHVILVGRGAGLVTGAMSNVFHVRLVASLPKRIERVQKLENLSQKEAARFIAKADRGRGRFAEAHFHGRIDDDLRYHMVLNTDLVPLPEVAQLIADGARRCFRNLEQPVSSEPMAGLMD
jgi:cytidylate kinase